MLSWDANNDVRLETFREDRSFTGPTLLRLRRTGDTGPDRTLGRLPFASFWLRDPTRSAG